ncbi:hypothetical protein [Marininema halotolerans]|uniref:Uncharacterized protein n=1 Tax=Marininema halotolerans TaxID=1155944 RepID=A0A1I6P3P8_9BACL|nr:hypothetical protein [Marininema halotolerans]SFS34795.1 hypothetical protein SAMN05444972_101339 [Marininema halotolerans]
MAIIGTIEIELATPRYLTSLKRLTQNPLQRICLGVQDLERGGEPVEEFAVNEEIIRRIFNETIGAAWNQHTLAQKGVPLPANCFPYPVFRVNYSPSLTNIATGVFQAMDPVVANLKDRLVYVVAQSADLKSTFFRSKNR